MSSSSAWRAAANPFLLAAEPRLRDWKAHRDRLAGCAEADQLDQVAAYWAQAPLLSLAYDPAAPAAWPGIWDMIRLGEWCRSSVAIGMEASLRLAGWPPARLTLQHIVVPDLAGMLLVLNIDNVWVLNYDWGRVVPHAGIAAHRVLHRMRHGGRHYFLID